LPDDSGELTVQGGLAAGETDVIHPAILSLAQDLLEDVHRQVALSRMTLVEAVQASQVAPVR
jgi:hypothetical protein